MAVFGGNLMLDGVCRLHVDVAYVVGCGALVGGWGGVNWWSVDDETSNFLF